MDFLYSFSDTKKLQIKLPSQSFWRGHEDSKYIT